MTETGQDEIGPLKMIVCIKQVPLLSALRFDQETRRLVREGVPLELNELDVYALTEAIRLRERHGGEVIAMTMGPPQAHEALATALAMGADRAIHLNDRAFGGADTMATARALALAIERERPDIVFCGRHSIDAETAQVGPELAEMLNLPHISAVEQITLQHGAGKRELLVTRETDEGDETLIAPLPVLLTATEKLNEGIWPDEQAIHEASEQVERYQILSAADLHANLTTLGQQGSPTWVATVEEDTYARAGEVITESDPAQAAKLLLDALEARGLLQTEAETGQATKPAGQAGEEGIQARQGEPLPGRAVWVVAERSAQGIRRVTLELLGKGVALAAALQGELAAVLIGGPDAARDAQTLAAYGAERIYVAAHPALAMYTTDGYTAVLAGAIERHHPAAVLLGSTANGRDLAPRVAARLHLGLTGDCIDLGIDEQGRLIQYKPAFGNKIISSILSSTLPAMATLRPGMLSAIAPDSNREAVIETLPVEQVSIRTPIVSQQQYDTGVAELEAASIVLGVGMGMGEPERYGEMYKLAELLHAAIGATRNVADQGWLPKQKQIGLTGRAISPRLYIALGVRGAPEHIAGIRKAGFVVSINKNKRAAIFRHSDIGVVADVHALLPHLVEQLERRTQ